MRTGAFLLAASSLLSCQSEETKRCRELFAQAQKVVLDVDSKSIDSVRESLGAVEAAMQACDKAERYEERDELAKARNQFKGHLDYLEKKAAEKKRKKRSPEEIARLVKTGDPSCPKGQAYKHDEKMIRCTGPQLIDMPWATAKEYFDARGYKITSEGNQLRMEYGAELYVFTYPSAESTSPPQCLTIHPPPGMSWQEAAARATAALPQRLEQGGTVPSSRGKLPLSVKEEKSKVVVRLGQCQS